MTNNKAFALGILTAILVYSGYKMTSKLVYRELVSRLSGFGIIIMPADESKTVNNSKKKDKSDNKVEKEGS